MNSFDNSYYGKPPWDIDRPQSAFIKLSKEYGDFGHILDIGCGTGENSLIFAKLGYSVTGIDSSPKAIELASKKLNKNGLKLKFQVRNALNLANLVEKFDTIIDSGLFHIFSDIDRKIYIENLYQVLKSGGSLFILCFSDRETPGYGPRRVSKEEIKTSFEVGWDIENIEETKFETNFLNGSSIAWLIKLKKRIR
ncbi:MAG: class I SAM-dependent methyltransferase [Candidatus Hodarchaeales archaeon]|jgi:cyclopropane fatty-acyl-phospholipid synthase-like methyltransferase